MPAIQTTEAARALGSVRTAKKAAACRANLAKGRKKVADALAAFQQPADDEKFFQRWPPILIPATKEKS